jgi:hypothetical protein
MGADGVGDLLPLAELPVEGLDGPGAVGDLIELLGMGALGPLDGAVELGAFGRQDEEPDPPIVPEAPLL